MLSHRPRPPQSAQPWRPTCQHTRPWNPRGPPTAIAGNSGLRQGVVPPGAFPDLTLFSPCRAVPFSSQVSLSPEIPICWLGCRLPGFPELGIVAAHSSRRSWEPGTRAPRRPLGRVHEPVAQGLEGHCAPAPPCW